MLTLTLTLQPRKVKATLVLRAVDGNQYQPSSLTQQKLKAWLSSGLHLRTGINQPPHSTPRPISITTHVVVLDRKGAALQKKRHIVVVVVIFFYFCHESKKTFFSLQRERERSSVHSQSWWSVKQVSAFMSHISDTVLLFYTSMFKLPPLHLFLFSQCLSAKAATAN